MNGKYAHPCNFIVKKWMDAERQILLPKFNSVHLFLFFENRPKLYTTDFVWEVKDNTMQQPIQGLGRDNFPITFTWSYLE